MTTKAVSVRAAAQRARSEDRALRRSLGQKTLDA